MSKAKIEYVLSVNGEQRNIYTFAYKYGNIKSAYICLNKKGFSIHVNTSASIDADMIINSKSALFNDAINKSIMLYLVHFNKAVDINEIVFSIDGNKHIIPKEKFPIICTVSEILNPPLQYNGTQSKVDQFILNYKEKYRLPKDAAPLDYIMKGRPRIMASLIALLTAKSKTYEYERFLHLWMAMNGLYGYASYLYEHNEKREAGKKKRLSEIEEMSFLWQFFQWVEKDNCKWKLTKRDKSIIADKTIRILQKVDAYQEIETLINLFTDGTIAEDIQKCLVSYPPDNSKEKSVPYDLTTKVYVTFLFPYYLRCTYFHANKPLPLIAAKNDKVIHVLKIVNTILEAFLSENLPLWMDAEYIEKQYLPKSPGFVFGKSLS